jgi:alpha-beta hydrolase superfamily lysophospholipase
MFSRSDADALRAQLPAIDFKSPIADDPLVHSYRQHYGLDAFSLASHHMGTFTSDDYTVVCQYFSLSQETSKGSVLILHGYYDHVGLFTHLISHCLELGYSVVIFDLPGHGLSTGPWASINSFREYSAAMLRCLEIASSNLPGPWSVIGQSTGSAVIMDTLLKQPEISDQLEHSILLCPLLYPVKWNVSRRLFYLLRLFRSSSPRRFAENSHDREFLNFIKTQDPLQCPHLPARWVTAMMDYQRRFESTDSVQVPVEIVQGTEDGTVDWQRNLKVIEKKFPAASTHLIEGARHHLVNESEPYRQKVFDKITEILTL